jgi:tetratricopeptide (TPR) repeat protein
MRRIRSCVLFVLLVTLLGAAAGCGSIRARQAMHKGITYYKAHRYEEASKEFQAAADYNSNWTEAWLNRGFSCKQAFIPNSTAQKDKDFAQCAIESFTKYIEQVPGGQAHDDGVEYLISVYLDARRQDEALAYFKPLMDADPTNLKKIQAVRAIYQSMGNTEETSRLLGEELKYMTTGKETVYYTLCAMYEFKVRPTNTASSLLTDDQKLDFIAKGIENCKQAVAIKDDYADAYIIYNLIHRWRSQIEAMQAGAIENDKVKQDALNAQAKADLDKADEFRSKAMALIRARREADAREKGLTLRPSAPSAPAVPGSAPGTASAPSAPAVPASAPGK